MTEDDARRSAISAREMAHGERTEVYAEIWRLLSLSYARRQLKDKVMREGARHGR